MKIILSDTVGNGSRNLTTNYGGITAFLKGLKAGLLVNFCQIFMLLDPDPNSQYGSGSRTAKSLWIQIHSTNKNGKDYEPGPLFLKYRTNE